MMKFQFNIIYRFIPVFLGLLSFQLASAQFYNGSQQEFGKNRVQYKTFDWLYYPAEELDVYFYNGGKDLAEFTVQSARISLLEVQRLFDYTMQERVQIIVYNTQTDYRQSNVGIPDDGQDNIGGTTEIVGSKLFVYFDGDHGNFAQQIREGLARVLFNQMMLGGNWKDVLRSSTFLTIPEWYKEGLVSYCGSEWNSEADQFIRDGINTGLYESFNNLQGVQVKYAGHAMWKYIADVYGENVIPNILYMTKISRNIEDGFLFVLGQDLFTISDEFTEYWNKRFQKEQQKYPTLEINRLYDKAQIEKFKEWEKKDIIKKAEAQKKFDSFKGNKNSKSFKKIDLLIENWETLGYKGKKWRKLDKRFSKYLGAIPVKYKKKYTYSQFNQSPNGEYISFVTHELGQYKVWLYHISSGKLKRIIKKQHKIDRIQDLSYPNTTWHPNGDVLTFITERRGRVYLNNYTLSANKTAAKELFRIDKVIDLSYSDDGKKIVFSGVAQGQTDLYMYYVIGNNQTRITNDVYDDLNPSFLPNSEAILFASNRPDDTLRKKVPLGVYSNIKDIYILYPDDEPTLEQITRTPEIDEEQPKALSDKYYSYLSYRNNFKNQFAASVDSAISRIDTTIHYRYFTRETLLSNYALQLDDYQVNSIENTFGYSFYKDGRYQYNWGKLDESGGIETSEKNDTTPSKDLPSIDAESFAVVPIDAQEKEIDPYNYQFEDERIGSEDIEREIVRIQDMVENPDSTVTIEKDFQLPKSRNYRLNFVIDEVTTQIDNSLGFQMYQTISPNASLNQGSGIGGMAKVSDLFEDHKLKGIVRMNVSRAGIEAGMFYKDLRKRIDKEYSGQYFSRRTTQDVGGGTVRVVQSKTLLATYKLNYAIDEVRSLRGTLIGTMDNLTVLAIAINDVRVPVKKDFLGGLRLAYIFDNTRQKGLNILEGTRYKAFAEYYRSPTEDNSDFKVIGFDFRHYEHIYRNLTFAFRGAGSTSFGGRTLLNRLGGVDSELLPKQGDGGASSNQNYYYLSHSAPMRGFWQNSRSGNNFAVINSELRWPVFQFFSKKPLNSEFTKSFQFTLFSDVGSAWNGPNPYSQENEFNEINSQGNPVSVTVKNNREPIIWSYGFGARAKILGYFIRADYGWGVDDGQILDGVLHLSLNLDF